jgi:hypothetical protein
MLVTSPSSSVITATSNVDAKLWWALVVAGKMAIEKTAR